MQTASHRHLTTKQIETMINDQGAVVDIGQISDADARLLNRFAKQGKLIKYRGFWNNFSPLFGMGPLKTIWALPEFAKQMGAC